ncbi:MAG: regulatory protein RecX [Thermoleophilaceae bacterium]
MGQAKELERAFALAYRALNARDRTEHELRAFLERKAADSAAIDAAIAELAAIGAIDDRRYAQRFTADRRSLDHWGSERIAQDLARRGVDRELIDAALSGVDRDDELGAAVELLGGRFPNGLAGDKERDRAWRLLVRRGYEPELAYAAVRRHGRGFEGHAAA